MIRSLNKTLFLLQTQNLPMFYLDFWSALGREHVVIYSFTLLFFKKIKKLLEKIKQRTTKSYRVSCEGFNQKIKTEHSSVFEGEIAVKRNGMVSTAHGNDHS